PRGRRARARPSRAEPSRRSRRASRCPSRTAARDPGSSPAGPLPRDTGRVKPSYRLRQVANALNLSTALGLLLAVTAARGPRGVRRGPDGLLVAGGYRPPFPVASVFTVGNVVLLRGDASRLADGSRLMRHEARHA